MTDTPPCPTCNGKGFTNYPENVMCEDCGGTGREFVPMPEGMKGAIGAVIIALVCLFLLSHCGWSI